MRTRCCSCPGGAPAGAARRREIGAAYERESSLPACPRRPRSRPYRCPTPAQSDDPAYLEAQRAFATEHPWFSVHNLDARSHFPTIEVPDQMAAVIEHFVIKPD